MTGRRLTILATTAAALSLAACDGDGGGPEGPPLKPLPQLLPNAESGVLGFELVALGRTSTVDAVFINGGRQDLVVDLARLRIEGPGASAYTIGEVIPPDGVVDSREAFGIPLTFTSPGRGVYLATLVVESNAENFPEYRLELVGPGADQFVPEVPDIEFFEDPVTVEQTAFLSVPTALVRFYNLGARSLNITRYELADPVAFAFLAGTAQPGAACTYGAICGADDGPAQGCCEGDLDCACLEFGPGGLTCEASACEQVSVTGGQFSILGVTWASPPPAAGAHATTLTLTWSCSTCDPPLSPPVRTAEVSITGTR